ncbi:hypothetical protein E2C01_087383 [Portunus trituberculatus]|uniref:Uncharacterized protein n=1 Tax=Portunus trituberculatus TaxID=210409 RepID=A0A5B7JJ34_PORTR|nr:hypothetical protein [Portunus trituberculatus]
MTYLSTRSGANLNPRPTSASDSYEYPAVARRAVLTIVSVAGEDISCLSQNLEQQGKNPPPHFAQRLPQHSELLQWGVPPLCRPPSSNKRSMLHRVCGILPYGDDTFICVSSYFRGANGTSGALSHSHYICEKRVAVPVALLFKT